MAAGFVKQSIGFKPLASTRDWAVFGCIVAGFLIAVGLIWTMPEFSSAARGAIVGGLVGMLPSLMATLPVRGTVKSESGAAFLGRVAQYGFVAAGETAQGQLFNYKAKRWMRWDSNRILLRHASNGDMQATIPLFFYRQLKRHHS